MQQNMLWKIGLILAVIAVSIFYLYPPKERINLGLDLQGGSHIVMQVVTQSALKYEIDLDQTRVGQALKDKGLVYAAITPTPDSQALEITGTDPGKRGDVRKVLTDYMGQWKIDDLGSGGWRVSMTPQIRQAIETNAVDTTLTTLRTRIDGLGVREAVIQKQGMAGDRILILLPGVEDPERAKDVIQKPAILEWKTVTYPPGVSDFSNWAPPAVDQSATLALFGGSLPPEAELFPEHTPVQGGGTVTRWWPLARVSTVVGPDLKKARRVQGQFGDPQVSFQLSPDAGKRFEIATTENVGRRMAIVLGGVEDKVVISAPMIKSKIRDSGVIEGSFDVQSAEDMALKLNSGAVPADVNIIEERTVGPSLGRDSIKSGLLAGAIGFLSVMIFMVVYYRLSGVNAVVALALNVVLVLGAMGYFGATLTLPGIAGLILTVGMAVDSNVLIFERIREELHLGKTVRSAVEQGFSRAFGTIVDTHVTTLVSAFFLFSYGTGAVKGFAVTLTVGLLISMFTAVFVSRVLFDLVLGQGRKVESLSI
jgi:preprotein translocase subunit SecD